MTSNTILDELIEYADCKVSNHPYLFFIFLFCYNLLKTPGGILYTMNKEEKAKLWADTYPAIQNQWTNV